MTEVHQQVLILAGPPGAGKTTVARLLAGRHERAVHIESDHFFKFIKAGYIEPWKTESHEQNTVVMGIVAEAAAAYATAGYFTIVDGIIAPGWFFEPMRDTLQGRGLDVAFAVLRPSLPIAIERANKRSPRTLNEPAVIEQLWTSFDELGYLEHHVINNEMQDPMETAGLVAERLRLGQLRT